MKKIKVGISFFILIIVCLIFKKFLLLANYFSALILHELSHALVAKKQGYKIKSFNIDLFGVSLDLEEELSRNDSFLINIAGPMCNLLLCLICTSIFWLFPKTYMYLSTFCVANFTLAVFNLLPVYPLDGGKIFSSLITSNKVYSILDKLLRIVLSSIFVIMFIYSCFNNINFMLLIMAVFFLTSSKKRQPMFSLFKHKNMKSQKCKLIKISYNTTILELLKMIRSSHYTIFYLGGKVKFLDEDEIISVSTKHSLTTKLHDIFLQ